MTRSKDPFQIPKAGLEIAPVAGLASINVNGSVGAVPAGEFLGESTLGCELHRESYSVSFGIGSITWIPTRPWTHRPGRSNKELYA